jgi:hypothetical protein
VECAGAPGTTLLCIPKRIETYLDGPFDVPGPSDGKAAIPSSMLATEVSNSSQGPISMISQFRVSVGLHRKDIDAIGGLPLLQEPNTKLT